MKKGFTMIELIMVVVIIGILSAIALPQYGKAKERALGKEAIASLKLIYAAERIYRMEANPMSYYPASATDESDIANINDNLRLFLNENNWDYSITGGTNSFTASAARNGDGGYLECQYTFTYNDANGEPDPNADCP